MNKKPKELAALYDAAEIAIIRFHEKAEELGYKRVGGYLVHEQYYDIVSRHLASRGLIYHDVLLALLNLDSLDGIVFDALSDFDD